MSDAMLTESQAARLAAATASVAQVEQLCADMLARARARWHPDRIEAP